MTNQQEPENELSQPSFGHRHIKQHIVRSDIVRREGLVESLLSGSGLCVDKLAADLVFQSELRDRFRSGQSPDGQLLTLLGIQSTSGTVAVNLLMLCLGTVRRMDAHV